MKKILLGYILGLASLAVAAAAGFDIVDVPAFKTVSKSFNIVLNAGENITCTWTNGPGISQTIPAGKKATFTLGAMGKLEDVP